MNCRRVAALLSDSLEGHPAGRDAAEVAGHLQDCPACRRLRDQIVSMEGRVREVVQSQPDPFPPLRERALERWLLLEEGTSGTRHGRQRLPEKMPLTGYALSGAALAVAAVVLALAGRSRPPIVRVGSSHPAVSSERWTQTERAAPHAGQRSPAGRSVTRHASHGVPGGSSGAPANSPPSPRRFQARPLDDLAYVNQDPVSVVRQWAPLPRDEWEQLEARVHRSVRVKDDFVAIPFPRLASTSDRQIAAAVESYKHEAAIVDARLAREVTLQLKGTALSDLCDQLRAQTGVQLVAGRTVSDEKVTAFCEKVPLRQVMREVNHLFGYTWLRHGSDGAYRYELGQDLHSQLLEEELRNRDREAALLALDAELQSYRPYLQMSFDELKRRWDQLSANDQRLIWTPQSKEENRRLYYLARAETWGAIHLYHNLIARDRAALLSGQELVFSPDDPNPDRHIPPALVRPLLQAMGDLNLNGRHVPMTEVPGVQLGQVRVRLKRSELGACSLSVIPVAVLPPSPGPGGPVSLHGNALTPAHSPSNASPDNAAANASLRGRPPFDRVVSWVPEASRPAAHTVPAWFLVLSSDVWEAIHKATGMPIVADYYTRLYVLSDVKVQDQPLFEALCRVGDALGMRWRKDGDFLLARNARYFWDDLKEVPNRFLQRWEQDRDDRGGLPLADFLEMAGMTDDQLDAAEVADALDQCWGLPEWAWLHQDWLGSTPPRQWARLLGLLTLDQRRRTLEPAGLPVRDLTRAQRQAILQLFSEQSARSEQEGGLPQAAMRPDDFAQAALMVRYLPWRWELPPSVAAPVPARPANAATAAGLGGSAASVPVAPSVPRWRRQFRQGAFDVWLG